MGTAATDHLTRALLMGLAHGDDDREDDEFLSRMAGVGPDDQFPSSTPPEKPHPEDAEWDD